MNNATIVYPLLLALGAQEAAAKEPVATYRVSAETEAGLGASPMSMLAGGGATHQLTLQLGSTTRAQGAPVAEHFVPPALKAGRSLSLQSLTNAEPEKPERGEWAPPGKVKMRLYWGCGDSIKPGQPRVIDLSGPAAIKAMSGIDVRPMTELTPDRFAGYGKWPNGRDSRTIGKNSSLVGQHNIQSNYAPEINFALAAEQDFLAPLKVQQQPTASGAMALSWNGISRARGYFLSVMGTDKDGTPAFWISSQAPLATFMISGYLAPSEVDRLIQLKAVLPASETACTVPANVLKAIESPVLMMTAFGNETNIAQPRPANADAAWRPDWTVKFRYRSNAKLLLGQEMPSLAGAMMGDADEEQDEEQPKSGRKGSLLKGLGKKILSF